MIIDIARNPEQAGRYRVFDAATGEELPCIYADDARGYAWCVETEPGRDGRPIPRANARGDDYSYYLFSGPIRIEAAQPEDEVESEPDFIPEPAPDPDPRAPDPGARPRLGTALSAAILKVWGYFVGQ